MRFEWDEDKNHSNIEKHGIDFADEDIIRIISARKATRQEWKRYEQNLQD